MQSPSHKHTEHTIDKVKYTLNHSSTVYDIVEACVSDSYNERSTASFSRSFLWKMSCLQLNKVSKPQGEVELNLGNLRRLREDYTTLRNEFQVPWNELPVDNEYYQTININDDHDITEGVSKKIELSRLRVQHDPLSLDDNTEHGNTITDLQTLETLITDVNRLFPEMPEYFINSLENRKRLIRILFNWWKLTGHSYSQGLHELVGLIFIVFQKECINPHKLVKKRKGATTESFETVSFTKLENQVIELLDENFLEHDTFNVFNVLIGPVIEKYYKETSLLQETVKFDLRLFETDKFQYHLFKNKLKLDSTIWLIRYFRLLLIREIGVDNSVQLWDKLICFGYIQDHTKIDMTLLLPYLIILLLSMIKSRLIISDYGEALFLLLHYPIEHEGTVKRRSSPAVLLNQCRSVDTVSSNNYSGDIHHGGLEDADDVNSLDFTYIEENHQHSTDQIPAISINSTDSKKYSIDSNNEGNETIELDVCKLASDSMTLYYCSSSETNVIFPSSPPRLELPASSTFSFSSNSTSKAIKIGAPTTTTSLSGTIASVYSGSSPEVGASQHGSPQYTRATANKLIESYSGMVNEQDRNGRLSASPIRKQRFAFGDMLKRNPSWSTSSSPFSNSNKPQLNSSSSSSDDVGVLGGGGGNGNAYRKGSMERTKISNSESKPIGGLSLGASLMRFTFGDDSTKLDSPKNSKVDGGSYALSKKKSTRDFDRTRLEMKLAKKVNDAMKK